MKWSAIAAVIAVSFTSAAQADVARVDFAVGEVSALAPGGERRLLTKGAELRVGDTVSVGQGRAQLRFADGAYMSLQPGTEFMIEQFRFDGKQDGSETIVMNLVRGGLRTITGLIGRANRQNYRLRTDVATIGIRGTEFSVRYADAVEVFCAEGSIFVQNETGILPLNGGEGARIASAQALPTRTSEAPVLSPHASPVTHVDEPVNPTQESVPTVAGLPVLVNGALSGTFTGNWAASTAGTTEPVVDAHTNESVALDAAGSLLSFSEGTAGLTTPGTSTLLLDGNDGSIAWGRWVNGLVLSTGSFAGANTSVAPLHWVAGLPTAKMPAGSASYAMIGATTPSCTPTCSATLNGSSLFADFDNAGVTLSIDMTVNGKERYADKVQLDITGAGFGGKGSFSGSGASLSAQGFFSGDAAARAGVAYDLSTASQQHVNGAIAYRR
jgi:hypothetical protein